MGLYQVARLAPNYILVGTESTLNMIGIWKENQNRVSERVEKSVYLAISSFATFCTTDYLVKSICPTLSLGRSVLLIGTGACLSMAASSKLGLLPSELKSFMNTVGKSSLCAGIGLALASRRQYFRL